MIIDTMSGIISRIGAAVRKAHTAIKEGKMISKTLRAYGYGRAASMAAMAGYGRPRSVVRRRRVLRF